MDSEEILYRDRAKLRELRQQHPEYTIGQLMAAVGRSRSFVKKWLKRFKQAPSDNEQILWSLPSVRKTPPKKIPELVVERILHYRDHPPANLKRTPGPRAILFYLKSDQELAQAGIKPPNSTSLVWRILVAQGRINQPKPHEHKPFERPQPYRSVQLDFKDASTVIIEPGGKKQHLVEILNFVDVGTSAWLEALIRADFNAYTSLVAVEEYLKHWGLPDEVTFDRDPRFVGSASGRDFPAPFVRFWHCLGVKVNLCPPHRPDLNAFVERLHRSLGSECLSIFRPGNEGEVKEVVAPYKQHYNYERPHQGSACHNQPPMVAHPVPEVLKPLPMLVNPDRWLYAIDQKRFARKVKANGAVQIGSYDYYVGREYSGKYVALYVDASKREFSVRQRDHELKRLTIKGLHGPQELPLAEYLVLIQEEAKREQRPVYQSAS
jgi:hypothetical protein